MRLLELEDRIWEMPYAVVSALVIISTLGFFVRLGMKHKSALRESVMRGGDDPR